MLARYHPLALRWFLVSSQYRAPLNYSDKGLEVSVALLTVVAPKLDVHVVGMGYRMGAAQLQRQGAGGKRGITHPTTTNCSIHVVGVGHGRCPSTCRYTAIRCDSGGLGVEWIRDSLQGRQVFARLRTTEADQQPLPSEAAADRSALRPWLGT